MRGLLMQSLHYSLHSLILHISIYPWRCFLSRNVSPKCTHSTHRGNAPPSPIESQDHGQPLVLLSQLTSKKSNKQRPLTSLIDSHWALHADRVGLLCFLLFDQEEMLRQGGAAATGSTKERNDFEMISCHRLDERTRRINAKASTCPFYVRLLILKPTQWSVSTPWVCGKLRHCVDWIEARVWLSKNDVF